MTRIKALTILITILLLGSCNNDIQFCDNHSRRDIILTTRMLDDPFTIGTTAFDEGLNHEVLIQYYGAESWGWFRHAIRVTGHENTYRIQLTDMRTDPSSKKKEVFSKDLILTRDQINSIKEKIETLYCNPVNLETNRGADGNNLYLIIKDNNKVQGFRWETFRERKGNIKAHLLLKTRIAKLVGELMTICDFPNPEKTIYHKAIGDSVHYEIYLANNYNSIEHQILLDGIEINQNVENIARLKLSNKDTLSLKERLSIRAKLLDGRYIEL